MQLADLNHTQLAPVLFSQLMAAVVHYKANANVAYSTLVWFKYNTAMSRVV